MLRKVLRVLKELRAVVLAVEELKLLPVRVAVVLKLNLVQELPPELPQLLEPLHRNKGNTPHIPCFICNIYSSCNASFSCYVSWIIHF